MYMVAPLRTGPSGHGRTGRGMELGNNQPILPTEAQFIMIYYIAGGKLGQGTRHKDSHSSRHYISFSKPLG